jgi:hypothetical protein
MKFYFLIISIFISLCSYAQYRVKYRAPDKKAAKTYWDKEDYRKALEEYEILARRESSNPEYNYKAGVCYLNTNIDKSKAIPHLEFAARTPSSFQKNAQFELSKAYMLNYRFDDAIASWKKFKEIAAPLPKDFAEYVEKQIENCNSAKKLIQNPLQITFENLGAEVNSEYPDYYPFINDDEGELVFTSRRRGTTGNTETYDGFYTADIFLSTVKDGKWSKAKNAGPALNTSGDDIGTSLSPDGQFMFIYSETEDDYGDLIGSWKKNKSWQKRNVLDDNINTAELELAGSISGDGQKLFFSSSRPGGLGGLDIWMSKKLPNGQWGKPVNLGEVINTKWDEDFPYISKDGNTLYFASQGHFNMGGYDIFKSEWNEATQQWSKPQNIGYPINTPDDNMTICFSSNERYAYIAAYMPDSKGDLDIYRVTFLDKDENLSALKGLIKYEVPSKNKDEVEVIIYKKGAVSREFPVGFNPPDKDWIKVETRKKTPKPDHEFRFIVTYELDGSEKKSAYQSYPKDNPKAVFKDITTLEVKKAIDPKAPIKKEEAEAPSYNMVPLATLTLVNKKTGEFYGTFQSLPNTGKYIIIAPPGEYQIEIEAEGFQKLNETITILDKASYKVEITKDFILKPLSVK